MKKTTGALAAMALLAAPAAGHAAVKGFDGQGAFRAVTATAPAGTASAAAAPKGSMLLRQAPGALTIRATVTGLAPGSAHAAAVYLGDCAANGPAVLTLPDLLADARGVARLQASVPTPAGADFVENDYYVAVLAGTGATAGAPVACANVYEFHNNAAATLAAVGGSKVTGSAKLWQRGNVLKGYVVVRGLVPGSVHALQVSRGSCAAGGTLAQTLPDRTVNRFGTLRVLLSVPTFGDAVGAGFAFNVLAGPTSAPGAALACGDLRPVVNIFARTPPARPVAKAKAEAKAATHPNRVVIVKTVVKKKKVVVVAARDDHRGDRHDRRGKH